MQFTRLHKGQLAYVHFFGKICKSFLPKKVQITHKKPLLESNSGFLRANCTFLRDEICKFYQKNIYAPFTPC